MAEFPWTAATPWFLTCEFGNAYRQVRSQEYPELWKRATAVGQATNSQALLIVCHHGIGKTTLLDLLLCWTLDATPHAVKSSPAAIAYQGNQPHGCHHQTGLVT